MWIFVTYLYSKQAQKCYCGAECCRGTIGGKKKTPVKSKKKAAASDKKKKEFEDESVSLFCLCWHLLSAEH